MPLLRLILALPFALIALYQAVGTTAPTLPTATTTSTAAAPWPWLPKGGNARPYVVPTKVISIPSATPQARWNYDWPLKPFDRPHPVRACLDDPRVSMDLTQRTFHFGIDISA